MTSVFAAYAVQLEEWAEEPATKMYTVTRSNAGARTIQAPETAFLDA